MKTLNSGSNQLTLEDNHTYDLVIPNDIDYLGFGCTGEIPNKIRNVIVPNPQTQKDEYSDEYPLNNLTIANVVYSGSDTTAPWGAKSLNGVDATYTPAIIGGFDNSEITISNDQSSTPVEFKLVKGSVTPTIMQEKINTCLLDSITAELNGEDVTSEVMTCIEFSSQPVYDEAWLGYVYVFTTKPGSELAAAINGKMLDITAILKDPTDSSKTYTWNSIMLALSQAAPAPVLPGDPLNVTLQGSMGSSAGYETANVSIDNSCNYLTISVSTNTSIDSASISDKQNIHSGIDGVISGDNDNIVTFTIPTTDYISGEISSIGFEFGLSGSGFTPEGPVIEATQLQTYDPSNYFELDFTDNGGTITAGTMISTPISTGIKVTLYANNVSAITSASATDYDYTETINGTIDSVNNTIEFNLPTSMYSSSGGCYTMSITIAYSGTAPVFNERCKWEEASSSSNIPGAPISDVTDLDDGGEVPSPGELINN